MKHLMMVALTMCLLGCSLPVITSKFPEGNILVMPINDGQSLRVPRDTAANTGRYLQTALVNQVSDRTNISAQAYISPESDANPSQPSSADAAAVGRKFGFKYVLVAALGAYRDAAPMTFEDDFIILSDAQLVDTSSSISVWRLAAPYRANGGSPGSIYPLLDEAAALIAKSIISNFQRGLPTSISGPNPPIYAPPGANNADRHAERLRLLQKLHNEGALTDAEYKTKKAAVLSEL
jgi:hypothetical protein